MHKIEQLEKKWYHYKFKVIMIPLVSGIVTAFVGSGGYYVYDKYMMHHHFTQTKPKTRVLAATKDANFSDVKVVMEEPLKATKREVIEKERDDMVFEPIIPVIDMNKEEAVRYAKKRVTKRVIKKHHKPHKRLVKAKANTYLTAKELASMHHVEDVVHEKPHVMKKMNFHATSVNYIETMKEKYEHSHRSRDALLLAKAFYKKSSYKEAEKWALKANKLNSKLDESWLLFAKSKAKMGKEQEAINILAKYYKKSKSAKAKRLIGQIKTGRI